MGCTVRWTVRDGPPAVTRGAQAHGAQTLCARASLILEFVAKAKSQMPLARMQNAEAPCL